MKRLMQGNEAVAEAAIKSGLKFFAAYPITPASEIMHCMAKKEKISYVHAEDEIAAANMVIGASLAGAKAMTSTSGPGFSLMQETIGLAFMTETPIVIVDVQRVGPSTGMPTLPSQGDILQSAYGTHGDTYPIVFYPNSVEECYRFTIEAFNAAEEASSPVILLSDGFLGHLYETIDLESIRIQIKERERKPLGSSNRHFTGLISEGDIPKTKDTQVYREWNKKVKEKIENVAKNYAYFDYLQNERSDTLLIAYGITSRVILPLKEKYSIFRPIRMYPILEKEIKLVSEKYKNVIVIEMNDGQYKQEIERILQRKVKGVSVLGGGISLGELKKEWKL